MFKPQTAIIISLLLFSFLFIEPVNCFMTYQFKGGNIHAQILKKGLSKFKASPKTLKLIGKGMNSQDNPLSKKWTIPENHSCDNKIKESFKYIEEMTKEACKLSSTAYKNNKNKVLALYKIGEAMHSLHDFYSHSNYVEFLVAHKMPIEVIDRKNVPAEVRTCYYMYKNIFSQEAFRTRASAVKFLESKHAGLKFHSNEEFQKRKHSDDLKEALDYVLTPELQFIHEELNKDSPGQLEGRIVSKDHDKTLFSLAKELAISDTTKQWEVFQNLVDSIYGSEKKSMIMDALLGKPLFDVKLDMLSIDDELEAEELLAGKVFVEVKNLTTEVTVVLEASVDGKKESSYQLVFRPGQKMLRELNLKTVLPVKVPKQKRSKLKVRAAPKFDLSYTFDTLVSEFEIEN